MIYHLNDLTKTPIFLAELTREFSLAEKTEAFKRVFELSKVRFSVAMAGFKVRFVPGGVFPFSLYPRRSHDELTP